MLVIPAIDIKGGKLVRLEKGNFDKEVEYSADPIMIALYWEKQGAQMIHVVDLDAAKKGYFVNFGLVVSIANIVSVHVQYGGGVRTLRDMDELFSVGISRVVIGTSAISNRVFLEKALKKYASRVVISADSLNGMVMIRGWQYDSGISLVDFIKQIEGMGAQRVLITDISRDGMMNGPATDLYREVLKNTNIKIIASGGVSKLSDLKELAALEEYGIESVIIGKAFYEARIDYHEAVRSLSS
ncbi:MAG: 1-(5-phosphoribosyl)-5-[(5-phosphoribosylamino)methylideneamino]imidazole-4-carboxamide isomerase [Actinobacteria bacterium]|nr:1-(5-phosphoribosyl)-5-[(5-phosphoribosylamino)methylideneamino]imidazole-4-carboxamide isomerase [Actinomycetota bacterium]